MSPVLIRNNKDNNKQGKLEVGLEKRITTVATRAKRSLAPILPIWDKRIAARTWSDFSPFFCLLFFVAELFPTSKSACSLSSPNPLYWRVPLGLLTLLCDCMYAAVPPATTMPVASNSAFLQQCKNNSQWFTEIVKV